MPTNKNSEMFSGPYCLVAAISVQEQTKGQIAFTTLAHTLPHKHWPGSVSKKISPCTCDCRWRLRVLFFLSNSHGSTTYFACIQYFQNENYIGIFRCTCFNNRCVCCCCWCPSQVITIWHKLEKDQADFAYHHCNQQPQSRLLQVASNGRQTSHLQARQVWKNSIHSLWEMYNITVSPCHMDNWADQRASLLISVSWLYGSKTRPKSTSISKHLRLCISLKCAY